MKPPEITETPLSLKPGSPPVAEAQYHNILESITDGYYETDLAGNFTFFNEPLLRLLGVDREELAGANYRRFMDLENVDWLYRAFNRVFQSGEDDRVCWELNYRGEQRFIETSVSLIRESDGKASGFRGIARDVTERQRADRIMREYSSELESMVAERIEEFRRSEEKYRTIIENIEDGYYEIDLKGRITFVNRALGQLLGLSPEKLLGRSVRELAPPEDVERVFAEGEKVIATGRPVRGFDWKLVNEKGEESFVELSVFPILNLNDATPTGLRGAVRDMTRRVLLERELLNEKRAAEQANRTKSEFLANMSHEIRTPINGIIGMAELALDTDLDETQRGILETINNEASALVVLINDILDFSKIEAEKMELEEIPFDLRYAVEDVAKSVSYGAQRKGIEFVASLASDVPARVIGDPGRLRQILANLAGNALKFTERGEIVIKGELAEDLGDRLTVRFYIRDTGIGIPEEKQDRIFDIFTQADGTTTRKYGGTGLGTTIAKQLVELMGGKINVESEVGRGTTFLFTVVLKKQPETANAPQLPSVELAGRRVLVVDDNRNFREMVFDYLESRGCRPVGAAQAEEALDLLNGSAAGDRFGLIVTDVQMPGMDGFEMSRRIRNTPALKDVPIIILSPVGRIGDGRLCREIGVEGYLTKPIRWEDLDKAVRSVLGLALEEGDRRSRSLVTRHSISEQERRDFRILLAEDYPTNREVARQHLLRAGYMVDTAENGADAVLLYREKHYDLILMDVQMPVMDGIAATRTIREMEGRVGRLGRDDQAMETPRAPIVAMTANALKGDRERFLAEGMDDYISKPLRRRELLALVEKYANRPTGTSGEPAAAEPEPPLQGAEPKPPALERPMDWDQAVEEFEGDREFLKEVLSGFLANARNQIVAMRAALAAGDAATVDREAHSIRGGAANLIARNLTRSAFELEKAAKSGDLGGAVRMLDRIRNDLVKLDVFARTL